MSGVIKRQVDKSLEHTKRKIMFLSFAMLVRYDFIHMHMGQNSQKAMGIWEESQSLMKVTAQEALAQVRKPTFLSILSSSRYPSADFDFRLPHINY